MFFTLSFGLFVLLMLGISLPFIRTITLFFIKLYIYHIRLFIFRVIYRIRLFILFNVTPIMLGIIFYIVKFFSDIYWNIINLLSKYKVNKIELTHDIFNNKDIWRYMIVPYLDNKDIYELKKIKFNSLSENITSFEELTRINELKTSTQKIINSFQKRINKNLDYKYLNHINPDEIVHKNDLIHKLRQIKSDNIYLDILLDMIIETPILHINFYFPQDLLYYKKILSIANIHHILNIKSKMLFISDDKLNCDKCFFIVDFDANDENSVINIITKKDDEYFDEFINRMDIGLKNVVQTLPVVLNELFS